MKLEKYWVKQIMTDGKHVGTRISPHEGPPPEWEPHYLVPADLWGRIVEVMEKVKDTKCTDEGCDYTDRCDYCTIKPTIAALLKELEDVKGKPSADLDEARGK